MDPGATVNFDSSTPAIGWSEFAAGTLQAQLGHFGGESGGLKLAETRVRSVPGEGLEPSPGKPSQDFKSVTGLKKRAYREIEPVSPSLTPATPNNHGSQESFRENTT